MKPNVGVKLQLSPQIKLSREFHAPADLSTEIVTFVVNNRKYPARQPYDCTNMTELSRIMRGNKN
jgi:hypothetical protein